MEFLNKMFHRAAIDYAIQMNHLEIIDLLSKHHK